MLTTYIQLPQLFIHSMKNSICQVQYICPLHLASQTLVVPSTTLCDAHFVWQWRRGMKVIMWNNIFLQVTTCNKRYMSQLDNMCFIVNIIYKCFQFPKQRYKFSNNSETIHLHGLQIFGVKYSLIIYCVPNNISSYITCYIQCNTKQALCYLQQISKSI